MNILPFRKKELLSEQQKHQLVQAIRQAERLTSGEIRLYVESRCRYVDPINRAAEIFLQLGMEKTKHRNGVLLYIALKDRQYAIAGDIGIHEKVGGNFWKEKAQVMLDHFSRNEILPGIENCIREIGSALQAHFPYDGESGNELPDDIVTGK